MASNLERTAFAFCSRKAWIVIELLILLLIMFLPDLTGIPRSIVPLFLLGWLSLRLRGSGWHEVGLEKPRRWKLTLAAGIALGILIQLTGNLIILPLVERITGTPSLDPRDFSILKDNLPLFLIALLGQWVLAGFGEEAVYRGYVLNRLEDLFGKGSISLATSVVLSSLLFSIGHGVYVLPFLILTFLMGCLYAGFYLLNDRNLWLPILAHATANSIGITIAYLK